MSFVGDDGFLWFVGVVEAIQDPMRIDRVRVRITGQHTENTAAIPTEALPWAQVVLPVSANDASTHDIWLGSTVFGFYLDGNVRQMPMVLGVLPGIIAGEPNYRKAQDKTISAYVDDRPKPKDKNVLLEATGILEPESPYDPVYPLNKVYESACGHVVEFDNTPGKERIHIFHKTGTFFEFHPDGSVVCKSLGDSHDYANKSRFEFTKDNKVVTVDGDYNTTVTGAHTIAAKGELTIKTAASLFLESAGDVSIAAGGTLRLKGNSVAMEASGALDIKAGGNASVDGSLVKLGMGAASSGARAFTGIEITPPTEQQINLDKFFMEFDDDTDAANNALDEAVANGQITESQAQEFRSKPEILEEDMTTPTKVDPGTLSCDALKGQVITDSLMLSKYYNVGMLTKFTAVSNYPLRAQRGLTEDQIVCNLQLLATKALDKIRDRYPNMYIQSGFRHGNGKSQHELGQACDLRFRGVSNSEYIEIAKWIRDNVPYDQLLLETLSTGSRIPWIHVSFSSARQRAQVLTLHNHKTVSQGLSRVS